MKKSRARYYVFGEMGRTVMRKCVFLHSLGDLLSGDIPATNPYHIMQIKDNIYYIGVNDRVKHRFEGLWLLPQGVSYNSYLIVDEKVALVDTVDVAFFPEYLEKIRTIIGTRPIDYLIINHMEPDHSGSLSLIRKYYPEIRLVGNRKTFEMVQGYYGESTENGVLVADGCTLDLGHRKLAFYLVPMLHWPETMVTFETTDGILFSGDAFGCFGALDGAVLDSEMDTAPFWPEMERYFASILGKFCGPVRTALKKLSALDIHMICSTHGPVWTAEVARAIDTYRRLSHGETQPGLVVCYGSMYGNTQRVAEAVAEGASEVGLKKIIVHNLSVAQPSFVLADVFRYKGLAIGGPTYNGGLFPVVEDLLKRLAGREVKAHKLGYFGGFTWAAAAVKTIAAYNEQMNMEVVCDPLEWKQGAHASTLDRGRELGRTLAKAVLEA